MILILTNQAVFVTLSVITIPPLAQCFFIFMLNQDDVIGDQSDVVTQNASLRALCCHLWSDINISRPINRGESWGRFPVQVPRICCWESIHKPILFHFHFNNLPTCILNFIILSTVAVYFEYLCFTHDN